MVEQDDGWTGAVLFAEAEEAGVWVTSDETSTNLLANPSFEAGVEGWRGAEPGDTGSVLRSAGRSAQGDASLRMALVPSPEGTRIARTHRIAAGDLTSADWSLLGQVLVVASRDVGIELHLIAKDAIGPELFFANARATDAAARGFAPLALEGLRLPAETATIEVLVTIIARTDGASGLVFWDALELCLHDRLPKGYLDGDAPGGISAMRATHRPSLGQTSTTVLDMPAQRGDRIEIAEGSLTLRAQGGEIRAHLPFARISPGDGIEIALRASGPTGLARLPETVAP